MNMKLGLFLPHAPPDVFKTLAINADHAGFDFICCDDHLISPFSPMKPGFEGCYEAWTAMAYLAGKTEKINLSHMALVPSFRGPALLAKMAATLDILSNGRLFFTVGAGWYRREFEAYNLPWESHVERIQREREAIKVIRSLWTNKTANFEGKFYTLREASICPRPLQKPGPPIWVAGDSRRSMELAAELGDGWLMHGHSPGEVQRMIAKIKPILGEREKHFSFGTAHFLLMGLDKEKADQKLHQIIPENTWNDFMKARIRQEIKHRISGSPKACLKRLNEYSEAGLGHLILIFLDPVDVETFIREVLPEI